jgi:hypothetical protein
MRNPPVACVGLVWLAFSTTSYGNESLSADALKATESARSTWPALFLRYDCKETAELQAAYLNESSESVLIGPGGSVFRFELRSAAGGPSARHKERLDLVAYDGVTGLQVNGRLGAISTQASNIDVTGNALSDVWTMLLWDVPSRAVGQPGDSDLVELIAREDSHWRDTLEVIGGDSCAVLDLVMDGELVRSFWLAVDRGFVARRIVTWEPGSPGVVSAEWEASELLSIAPGVWVPSQFSYAQGTVGHNIPGATEHGRLTRAYTLDLTSLSAGAVDLAASLMTVPEGTLMANLESGDQWIASAGSASRAIAVLADAVRDGLGVVEPPPSQSGLVQALLLPGVAVSALFLGWSFAAPFSARRRRASAHQG